MKNQISVLLVEDNESDQFLFKEALNAIKNARLYQVAGNGQEALDILENAATFPDLVFTDIHMPVMDGVEFLAEIIQHQRLKNIPVVVLSSDISQAELVQGMGAKAFISKPWDFKLLRQEIEHTISSLIRPGVQVAGQSL